MNSVVMAMVVFVGAGLIAMAMVALIGAAIPVVGPRMLRPRPWRRMFWIERWDLPRGPFSGRRRPGGLTSAGRLEAAAPAPTWLRWTARPTYSVAVRRC
jgi:hypothetical protein